MILCNVYDGPNFGVLKCLNAMFGKRAYVACLSMSVSLLSLSKCAWRQYLFGYR